VPVFGYETVLLGRTFFPPPVRMCHTGFRVKIEKTRRQNQLSGKHQRKDTKMKKAERQVITKRQPQKVSEPKPPRTTNKTQPKNQNPKNLKPAAQAMLLPPFRERPLHKSSRTKSERNPLQELPLPSSELSPLQSGFPCMSTGGGKNLIESFFLQLAEFTWTRKN